MQFVEFNLTPAELERFTGTSTAEVRDLRRKGMLKHVGSQDSNGRWKYSIKDALHIWAYRHLVDCGMQRELADWAGEAVSVQIFFSVESGDIWSEVSDDDWEDVRFYVASKENGEWSLNLFSKIDQVDSGVCQLIDMKVIASLVPKCLVQQILSVTNSLTERS